MQWFDSLPPPVRKAVGSVDVWISPQFIHAVAWNARYAGLSYHDQARYVLQCINDACPGPTIKARRTTRRPTPAVKLAPQVPTVT